MKRRSSWHRVDSYIPAAMRQRDGVMFRVVSFRAENDHALVDLDAKRSHNSNRPPVDLEKLLVLMGWRE